MKVYGWLIYNGSLTSQKYLEINKLYKLAAENRNISLDLIKNSDLYATISSEKLTFSAGTDITTPDFVLFLDKDIRLAKHLELIGLRVFNSSTSIGVCDDKILTYQVLAHNNIRIPKTILAPLVFLPQESVNIKYIDFIEKELGYPLVIKEAFGSFGLQVYLANNRDELIKINMQLQNKPHLYQEFIKSSSGRDVRLHVVGDRFVTAMMRTNNSDFRANISNGGEMNLFEPPKEFINIAIEASKAVGTDFAGVDILFDKDGLPIICEVNSNAHIKNILDCTGINVADAILDHIVRKLSE